ncbi:MAG TPA: ABC transporter ATP-binding protein [Polyangiaceae bacterium]|jgi:ABC-type multidrug transport system fused ATPase/permease subunit
MPKTSVIGYYVQKLGRVLGRPGRLLSFALASSMHAVGHAMVALVAGGVAVALARAWGLRDLRSSPLGDGGTLPDTAFLLSLIGLAVIVAKSAAGVYATFVQARVAGEVGSALRLELLDALLAVHRLRRPRHPDQGLAGASATARGVAALTERVHDVELGLKQGLLGGARAVAQLVPLGVVLVALAPRMAAVALVVLVTFGALLGRLRGGHRRAMARAAGEREALLEAADESVRHADLWVTYGAESKARLRVRALGEALARGAAGLEARAAAMSGANEALGAAALVAAIAASRAGWLGAVAPGDTLLAFTVAFFLAYRPLRELTDGRVALARAQVAYGELRQAIEGPAGEGRGAREPGDEDGSLPCSRSAQVDAPRATPWLPGALELRGLLLPRGSCGPLTLRVEAGSIVAIVGPTGIGKTTLLRTLLGLERAAAGSVLFDGASLDDAPAGPAARPFAWVPQDAPLLADTLAANVALGASEAEGGGALEPLGASHLREALDGARLGAGGRVVSGGERQWIALARAIATRQPVLLLDEPTSGLDADAQRRVLEAIARLRGQRTVLIVTHRPEPLAVADVVLRLEAGSLERAA